MRNVPRTIIELVEQQPIGDHLPPLHKAKEVWVNGEPVLLEQDGIDIAFGPDDCTVVTLRILASEVHFVTKPKSQE